MMISAASPCEAARRAAAASAWPSAPSPSPQASSGEDSASVLGAPSRARRAEAGRRSATGHADAHTLVLWREARRAPRLVEHELRRIESVHANAGRAVLLERTVENSAMERAREKTLPDAGRSVYPNAARRETHSIVAAVRK